MATDVRSDPGAIMPVPQHERVAVYLCWGLDDQYSGSGVGLK